MRLPATRRKAAPARRKKYFARAAAAWESEIGVEPRTVDVHSRRLREALEGPGRRDLIRTVRSAGYALESEPG